MVKKKTHTGKQRWCESFSSIPGIDAKSRLSLLFILSLALGDFSLGSPVFPSPQKPSPNSNTRCSLGIVEFCLCYAEFSEKHSVAYDLSKYSPVMLHLSPATTILIENPEM